MLSIPQAAERLGLSRQRVHQLVQKGLLPAVQVGRHWVIQNEDVEQRIKQEKEEGRPEAA